MFEKHFKDLQTGELFMLFEHGLSVKLTKDAAIDLFSGEIYPLHFNKKVSPNNGSLIFSQGLFLAQHRAKTVIVRKMHGGFELFHPLITKTEIVRETTELQGIPYGADDGVDIILKDILKNLDTVQTLTRYLANRRERQL